MNAPAALFAPMAVVERPVWATPEPGVYHGMPPEEYHAVESMSASGAKKMLQSPAHYRLMRTTPNEPTDAMLFGTAVHCGVLEPDRYVDSVVVCPDINKRTKEGRAQWLSFVAENASRTVLSFDQAGRAARCIAAVRAHPAASRLLDGARCEVSMFWQDTEYKVPCKLRADALNHGGVIDLKTTTDASPEGFGRQAANLLYHVQGAHYWSGCEHAMDSSPQFFAFIVVESEEPHAVACYTLPPVAVQSGRRKMDEALSRYRDALSAGKWPGYPETINPLDLPRYALRFDY